MDITHLFDGTEVLQAFLPALLPIISGVGSIIGKIAGGRAAGKQAQSQAAAQANRDAVERYLAQLQGARERRGAPMEAARMGVRGDVLSNVQDARYEGGHFTGGLRPSILGPASRGLGRDLAGAGQRRMQNPGEFLPSMPAAIPSEGAGGSGILDKLLAAGSFAGSVAGLGSTINGVRGGGGGQPQMPGVGGDTDTLPSGPAMNPDMDETFGPAPQAGAGMSGAPTGGGGNVSFDTYQKLMQEIEALRHSGAQQGGGQQQPPTMFAPPIPGGPPVRLEEDEIFGEDLPMPRGPNRGRR